MKKILTILLILPFISFAQCLEITEEDLIGKSFQTSDYDWDKDLIFSSDGFFRIEGKEKSDDYSWWIVDQIVFVIYDEKKLYFVFKNNNYSFKSFSPKIDRLLPLLRDKNRKEKFSINNEIDIWGKSYDNLYYGDEIIIKGRSYSDYYNRALYIEKQIFHNDLSDLFSKNIFLDTKECIDQYYRDNYEKWVKKGEYEKSEDYKNRVTEISKKNKSESLMQEAIRIHKEFAVKSFNNSKEKASDKIVIKDYSADNETFFIEIKNFEPINFPISISEAENFKKNFYPPKYSDLDLYYLDGKFLVSEITINDYKYTLFAE